MTIKGIILLAIGIVAGSIVYSMRPPDGLGDAITMALQNKGNHLEEPVYYALMGLSGLFCLAGVALFLKGIFKGKG